ncbi:NmrA family NAD(P)-binding protein [Streptomyces sp. NPDC056987]|uniref:NmrA family NAD(P)-binding protein n=1 Tax=Streptomyces sp. NPDC056987 TaxID=3345988 RepID=UPI00362519B1
MSASAQLTLVIGGTGKTGRRVVDRLTALGRPVRVGSRSGHPPFAWEDQATWKPALEGTDRVYIVHPDPFQPDYAEQIGTLAQAAADCGTRRLVLLSGRGDSVSQASEENVKVAGVEWTVVRAGWFNQNFSEAFFLDAIRAGELALPAGDWTEGFVDADDIADVAVAALTEDRHHGKTYELSGPRLLSFADIAAELSAATGRRITYTALIRETSPGDEPGFAEVFASDPAAPHRQLAHGVQEALGREPKDFSRYARDTAATGIWNA